MSGWKETDKSSIVSAVPATFVAVLNSFTSPVGHTKRSGVGVGCLGSNPGFTAAQMGGSGKAPQPPRAPLFILVKSGIMTVWTSKDPARSGGGPSIKHSAQCLALAQGSRKVSSHSPH